VIMKSTCNGKPQIKTNHPLQVVFQQLVFLNQLLIQFCGFLSDVLLITYLVMLSYFLSCHH